MVSNTKSAHAESALQAAPNSLCPNAHTGRSGYSLMYSPKYRQSRLQMVSICVTLRVPALHAAPTPNWSTKVISSIVASPERTKGLFAYCSRVSPSSQAEHVVPAQREPNWSSVTSSGQSGTPTDSGVTPMREAVALVMQSGGQAVKISPQTGSAALVRSAHSFRTSVSSWPSGVITSSSLWENVGGIPTRSAVVKSARYAVQLVAWHAGP
mmetsp:Transcript_35660/g.112512  ORF Transcript_35660/g.112512 Transcript_35660/m.112512 type:complete len:211 (-) Transcript_35660:965-1597(-)